MNNFFKVGDKVRILDGSGNKSYCGGWADGMNAYVGKTCIVIGSSERGVYLEGNVFTWDARYLELVEEKKMENKITIDGKEYKLSAELVEKIKVEVTEQERQDKKNLFERKRGGQYYYTTSSWSVCEDVDTLTMTDDGRYRAANYCCDKGLMKQRALHETLNRMLWRYSETHGGDTPWDGENRHYTITYCTVETEFGITSYWQTKMQGLVYFRDEAAAQAAIEEVVKPFMATYPEFVW